MALWWPSSTYAMVGAGVCPHNIGSGDFTLSAWVWPTSVDTGARWIIDVRAGYLGLVLSNGGNTQWGVYWSGGTAKFGFVPPNKKWSHLLATRRAGVVYGFMNGVQSATTHSITNSISNATVDIGGSNSGDSQLYLTAAAHFGVFASGCSKSQAMEIASGTPAVDVVDKMVFWAPADADSYSGRLLDFGPGQVRFKPWHESYRPKWIGDGPYMMPRKRNVSAGGAASTKYWLFGGKSARLIGGGLGG